MTAVAAASLGTERASLLDHGTVHTSQGGQYSFRVIGPCCRLFDREELPWPCCRLAWRSKEPSWRRVGRRFVPDLASRRCPSYAVELLQPGSRPTQTEEKEEEDDRNNVFRALTSRYSGRPHKLRKTCRNALERIGTYTERISN